MSQSPGWLARRVHHRDAVCLGDLVGDAAYFVAEELSRRVGWYGTAIDPSRLADPEQLWDEALTRGLRAPGFRMVKDGTTLIRATVTRAAGIGNETVSDVIQPNRVLELFESGASLVLQGLHFSDPALARLANNLALDLDQPVQVNAYISPRAARGLDLHFDFHDVLVVQLTGSKRWRVWDRLRRTETPVRGGPDTQPPSFDELGELRFDKVLQPGDCLHVPRGCPHAPETVDEASVHLTIGIMSFTRRRLVEQAMAATAGDPATAMLVPAGALGGTSAVDDPRSEPIDSAGVSAAEALSFLATRLSGTALRRQLAIEVWRRQPVTRLRPRCPVPVDDGTVLALTPGPLLWSALCGDEMTLGLGDRQLTLPAEAWPLFEAVLGEGWVGSTPAGLVDALAPALDAESVRTVVRRLVAEGVLAGD